MDIHAGESMAEYNPNQPDGSGVTLVPDEI
jgi:hypothetical protein